jgi:hypothetical protein
MFSDKKLSEILFLKQVEVKLNIIVIYDIITQGWNEECQGQFTLWLPMSQKLFYTCNFYFYFHFLMDVNEWINNECAKGTLPW